MLDALFTSCSYSPLPTVFAGNKLSDLAVKQHCWWHVDHIYNAWENLDLVAGYLCSKISTEC